MGPPDPRQRFEELYTEHYATVSGYVRRRSDDPHDVADVIAETFTTAWRRLGEVPPGDRARLWLYGVARRTLANHRRGESRRAALTTRLRAELAEWTGPAADPVADPVADPAADAVPETARAAFMRLSADDREVLSLVAWEGLGNAELAQVLGCSSLAVRQRLHRARKRLAVELAADDPDLARYGPRAVRLAQETS
ncbi:RNA polymerase sigma factor [Nonomuraea sp. NPDC049655]|uniref:RNA polymerase sigma factor n=1 Tax=Nonomuraea sp. NPDC049655 TaxID=3364355 RepID=UPI0037A4B20B